MVELNEGEDGKDVDNVLGMADEHIVDYAYLVEGVSAQ